MQYGGSQISSVLEHDVNVGCIKEELVTKFGVHKTDGRASLFTGPLAPYHNSNTNEQNEQNTHILTLMKY